MINVNVQITDSSTKPLNGSAGLSTQLPGHSTTVSTVSLSTGLIGRGKLIESDTK